MRIQRLGWREGGERAILSGKKMGARVDVRGVRGARGIGPARSGGEKERVDGSGNGFKQRVIAERRTKVDHQMSADSERMMLQRRHRNGPRSKNRDDEELTKKM